MANGDLLDRLGERFEVTDRGEVARTLDRILSGPQQETLAEAMAADAIDVVPVAGDLTAIVRNERAEDLGMEYPQRPAALENAFGDLPPPLGTLADILIAQNVMSHLERTRGIKVSSDLENITEDAAETADRTLDDILGIGPD